MPIMVKAWSEVAKAKPLGWADIFKVHVVLASRGFGQTFYATWKYLCPMQLPSSFGAEAIENGRMVPAVLLEFR